jgi:hypothetical protein
MVTGKLSSRIPPKLTSKPYDDDPARIMVVLYIYGWVGTILRQYQQTSFNQWPTRDLVGNLLRSVFLVLRSSSFINMSIDQFLISCDQYP